MIGTTSNAVVQVMASLQEHVAHQFPKDQTTGEDSDGVVDLPTLRIGVDVVAGLLLLGLAAGLATLVITHSGLTAAIAGAFGALIGAFVGVIIGASRFAGHRGGWRSPGTGTGRS